MSKLNSETRHVFNAPAAFIGAIKTARGLYLSLAIQDPVSIQLFDQAASWLLESGAVDQRWYADG